MLPNESRLLWHTSGWGDLTNSSDGMLWKRPRGSCQINCVNTSIKKLCNVWSIWACPDLNYTDWFFCLWSSATKHSGPMWTSHWEIFSKSYATINTTDNITMYGWQDVILWTELEYTCPHLSPRMCEYKQYNKSSLDHMFFPPISVKSIQPTCSLWQACTHTLRKTQRWGEGLSDKLTKASRGFLISGAGQLGIGRWLLTQRPRLTEK